MAATADPARPRVTFYHDDDGRYHVDCDYCGRDVVTVAGEKVAAERAVTRHRAAHRDAGQDPIGGAR